MNRLLLFASALLAGALLPCTATAQFAPPTVFNTFQPAAGNWHVAANWSLGIPIRGHTAVIPLGATCSIVSAPAAINLDAIQVDGTLTVRGGPGNTINRSILTDRIDVTGTFAVGSSAPNGYFQGTGQITLTHLSTIGNEAKHIEVHPGGTLLLYGDPTKKSWARLADIGQWQGSPSAALTVAGNALGWASGDQLAISTTDFAPDHAGRRCPAAGRHGHGASPALGMEPGDRSGLESATPSAQPGEPPTLARSLAEGPHACRSHRPTARVIDALVRPARRSSVTSR